MDDEMGDGDWIAEHRAGAMQMIFRALVVYLDAKIPGFSAGELRSIAEDAVTASYAKEPANEMTRLMQIWERKIIDEMLPLPQSDDEGD